MLLQVCSFIHSLIVKFTDLSLLFVFSIQVQLLSKKHSFMFHYYYLYVFFFIIFRIFFRFHQNNDPELKKYRALDIHAIKRFINSRKKNIEIGSPRSVSKIHNIYNAITICPSNLYNLTHLRMAPT